MVADIAQSLSTALGNHPPVLIFLAGPNGAGKSTFYEIYLAGFGIPFVNADIVRREMSVGSGVQGDEADVAAFRQAEEYRSALLSARVSFCTETVFSDTQGAKLMFLREAREAGYSVFLVFIGLESADLSTARVMGRVAAGGHDVPDEKLGKRFPRTIANLLAAIPLVNEAFVFDNSSEREQFRPVAVYRDGQLIYRAPQIPNWANRLPGL